MRRDAIKAAVTAGREAAYLKLGSRFDISNDAQRGAYVRRIREAMSGKLVSFPNMGAYTDTNFDRFEDIAREDGFEIGVYDRLKKKVITSAFVEFEKTDIVFPSKKLANS